MYNFNRGNNRFGGGRDFKKQEFGRRDFSDREMHRAVCAKCGNDCEVPFRPTGTKPVYCSKCFEHSRGSESGRFEDRGSTGGRFNNFENRNDRGLQFDDAQFKKQFEVLNFKLDKILKILNPPVPQQVVQEKKVEKIAIEEIVDKELENVLHATPIKTVKKKKLKVEKKATV